MEDEIPSIPELEEEIQRCEERLWELQQSGAPVSVLQSLQTDIDALYEDLDRLRALNHKDAHLDKGGDASDPSVPAGN